MEYRNEFRSSRYSIDCEINHPVHGWIPFTATQYDTEDYGRDIYDRANIGLPDWVDPPPNIEQLAAEARAKRNELLAASDWTQVSDAPVDQSAWAVYRQALRDITSQPGFPLEITWPAQP